MLSTKNILAFIIASLSISCAKNYDKIEYSEQNKQFEELLKQQIMEEKEYVARLQLARLKFEHNQLEEADQILSELVIEDPNNMEALAWYGANTCKIVGESQPWFMGLRKLARAKNCLAKVKLALENAPDDFTVQLIAISTGSIVNIGDSLDWATSARKNLATAIEKSPDYYPQEVIDYFHLAAAENDIALGNMGGAMKHLEKVREKSVNSFLVNTAVERMGSL